MRAISYVDDEHRRVAGHTNTDADAAALRRGAVVTEVAPTGPFCETVSQRRDCLPRNPRRFVRRAGSCRNPPKKCRTDDRREQIPGGHPEPATTHREDAVAAGPASLPPIVRFLIETASDRFVVSPRLTNPFEWLESDIDKATTRAETRLRTVLTHFQSGLGSLDGTVGDETLRLAIEDAMNDFKPDHLIIGIRTHDHDSWQERLLIANVRHRFHVPLTVFEIDDQGQSPAPAYNND